MAETEIERIGKQALVIGAAVEQQRQQTLGRDGRTCGVKLHLSDGNPHTVGPDVPQAEDALACAYANKSHVLYRPV